MSLLQDAKGFLCVLWEEKGGIEIVTWPLVSTYAVQSPAAMKVCTELSLCSTGIRAAISPGQMLLFQKLCAIKQAIKGKSKSNQLLQYHCTADQ